MGSLTVLLFSAVLQLALALHVRNILVDSAAEGARRGALAGASLADAADRTEYLIGLALSDRYTQEVSARTVDLGGVSAVRVDVSAPLPLFGLLGPERQLTVSARSVDEAQW